MRFWMRSIRASSAAFKALLLPSNAGYVGPGGYLPGLYGVGGCIY
jgi:hypothetical protein